MSPRIARALISVHDKQGLEELVRALSAAGVELFSTGGTRKFIEALGIPVRDVADYTGFPEMLDGRVKTLHPKVFGGILARRDRDDDLAALEKHGIVSLDLVVVNLYPFESTIAKPGVTFAEAIEQIDVGGPSMIRAAAKNQAFVTVAVDPSQYGEIITQIRAMGATTLELRKKLAQAAFARTAAYDQTIAAYLAAEQAGGSAAPGSGSAGAGEFPPRLTREYTLQETLRYGENPHQRAALYATPNARGANVTAGKRLWGKELSYNNLLDLDAALAIARSLPDAAAVVIKHNNPCGVASADKLETAARRALDGDAVSAFGSVLGFNRALDAATAEALAEPGRFIEAIVAPSFEPAAIEILTTKPKWKANVRLVEVGPLEVESVRWQARDIAGGLLVQESDTSIDSEDDWQVVTNRQPTAQEWRDLRFAWAIARHVKSNAIVLVKDRAVWGVGAGQMSRVDSVEIALRKAAGRVSAPVLASDAFFPFADSIDQAASGGVAAIIQPGGSRRDDEVIAACNQHNLPMVFTGRRHFKH